jgi:hypothetical protein
MKTLLMWSGGADSTFILYKLLTDTTDQVTAVVLDKAPGAQNSISHTPQSSLRIPRLIQELKKIRDFEVIRKTVTDQSITPETDHYYTYFINSVAADINAGVYDRIATGRTWEQQDQSVYKNSSVKGTPSQFAAERLFAELCTRGELWNPLVTDEYYENFSRWHVFEYLPQNILELTLSCHSPNSTNNGQWNEPCGRCYKCLWDQKVQDMRLNGYTAEHVNAWRRLKSLEYGGNTGISAPIRYWLPIEMRRGKIINDLRTKQMVIDYVNSNQHYSLQGKSNTDIWSNI